LIDTDGVFYGDSGFGWETSYSQCTTSFESTVVFSVDASGITYSDLTYGPGQAWAWPLMLFYQSSDSAATTSSTGTFASTTSALSALTATGSGENSPTTETTLIVSTETTTPSPGATSGPSTGAKVGAGVGAFIVVALLLAIITLISRYCRKKFRNASRGNQSEISDPKLVSSNIYQLPTHKPELQGREIHGSPVPQQPELQGFEVHQTPTANRLELQVSEVHQLATPLAELQGSEIHQLPTGE
jgi:hypothetical protein